MTVSESTSFDDLIAQGLAASRADESVSAIACFEQASAVRPAAGLPQFLLGAEFAALGEMTRAEAAFANATRLAPEFPMARYQLGLLQFSSGRAALAVLTWEPLLQLPATDPLPYFVRGFCALANDEFPAALRYFEEGLPLNTSNPPLSGDIAKVMDGIRALVSGGASTRDGGAAGGGRPHDERAESGPRDAEDVQEPEDATSAAHVLLSNYRQQGPAH
jgi:tetratricopeptide (TPR) repeat protein